MMEATVNGVLYEEVPDTDDTKQCVGCAGDVRTGEGICFSLPGGCSERDTQWRRVDVIKPPAPAPQATLVIDETELREFWKDAYLTAVGTHDLGISPFEAASFAVADYKRARNEGIV
jgi:hypothetical protein